jgi:chorismate dehydratase
MDFEVKIIGEKLLIHVGYLTYLNVAPYYWNSKQWDIELIPCVPSELGQLAAQGNVDAGPLAVADWFVLNSEFEPLGPYGIASQEIAQSVLLFSHRPIQDLNEAVVGVTDQTSTSVRLLKLLLEHKHHVYPRDYQRSQRGDAWLVIGDEALREKKLKTFPYVYDLGEEWWMWRNLPFVFARWVVRSTLPSRTKEYLYRMVSTSFEEGIARLEEIALRRAEQSSLSEEEVLIYLRNFTYFIGEKEEQGLAEFRSLLLGMEHGGKHVEQDRKKGS